MSLFFSCKFPKHKENGARKHFPIEASHLPGLNYGTFFPRPPPERQQLRACHPLVLMLMFSRLEAPSSGPGAQPDPPASNAFP